jgi:hypothetical protein
MHLFLQGLTSFTDVQSVRKPRDPPLMIASGLPLEDEDLQRTLVSSALAIVAVSTMAAQEFKPNSLVLSRSAYAGDASTVSVGDTFRQAAWPASSRCPCCHSHLAARRQ